MVNLDSLDRVLLSALRMDEHAPVAELARGLGATRTTITRHIDAPTDAGVILGFTARVVERVDAVIRVISHLVIEGPYVEETTRMLRRLPEVTALHATNGEWDLIAEITVTKPTDIDVVLSAIRNSPGVHRSETSILLRSVLMWRIVARSLCGPDAAPFPAPTPEPRWKPTRSLVLIEYFTKSPRASKHSKKSATGTPYTVVRQASIVASAARIFPCIEDFRAWRAWSLRRQLDPGVQEGYSALGFGVGAYYRWSGNRETGAGSMILTHSDPPRQHSDPPRIVEIDLVFVKPFPNRNRIEFVLGEKRGQASGGWRPHGGSTGAMRFFRLLFNMDIAASRDLKRGLERLRQAVKSDQEASRAGRTE